MRLRSLLIWLVLILAMVPLYYSNRWLQKMIRPRENAGRFFLFLLAYFMLVVVYAVLVVGLVVRFFGR